MSMLFSSQMEWTGPENHESDCYFCLCDLNGHTSKSKQSIILGLWKELAELLSSILKEKNLLAPGTNITFYRTRD
ncbi:hypothetical protein, partial [Enterobacter cloacae complex sp. 4DZ3-17B2]|uniref:hypothetical protein n=1 Tax=Enterobacter cloacae complex sp. 4DZ3-17B2 TaxID=2511990 RepID=UPI001CA5E960